MFNSSTFPSEERFSKGLFELKVDITFFKSFNTGFAVMSYITGWFERYVDVYLAINYIMMAFIKNGNINSLFRNYIFANAKYKINI